MLGTRVVVPSGVTKMTVAGGTDNPACDNGRGWLKELLGQDY